MNHLRQWLRPILARTFNRMTTYLAVFNFCMLCVWLYDSDAGTIFKEQGMRPGDIILIVLFLILFISAIEMLLLGMEKEEE